jgi:hypothetical protein
MPTTVASQLDIAKEVWDSDSLEKQFYDDYPFLKTIEKRQRVVIGKRAQVPLHSQRAGGTTVATSAGTTAIHTSGAEVVDQAQYNMTYNYFPVGIQVGALNEITGGPTSVGDSYEGMITGGMSNVRNHVLRQFLTGHGRIAQCQAGGASTTLELEAEASTDIAAGEVSGTHALQMGWIVPDRRLRHHHPGQPLRPPRVERHVRSDHRVGRPGDHRRHVRQLGRWHRRRHELVLEPR